MSTLGVRVAQLDSRGVESGLLEPTYPWLEWTVDGVPLRRLYSPSADDRVVTMLQARDAEDEHMRTENLLRLRGDAIAPPIFEPRFHRTRLDRFLHLRGTPCAPAGTAFEDGRVGLLYCYCGDLDCGALSTWIDVTAESVLWRDIGWQVSYRPYAPYDPGQDWPGDRDLAFDRAQYVALINQLLDADWSHGLPKV